MELKNCFFQAKDELDFDNVIVLFCLLFPLLLNLDLPTRKVSYPYTIYENVSSSC